MHFVKRSDMATHSFTCKQAIPAFTHQPQSITTLWLVLILPSQGRLSRPGWLWNSVVGKTDELSAPLKTACCQVVSLYPTRGRFTFWEVELRQSATILRPDWPR